MRLYAKASYSLATPRNETKHTFRPTKLAYQGGCVAGPISWAAKGRRTSCEGAYGEPCTKGSSHKSLPGYETSTLS